MSRGASLRDRAGGPKDLSRRASQPKALIPCARCGESRRRAFYQGRRQDRCKCHHDYRTPVEIRRDAVLDKYGDDPAAYTPQVLSALAEDGLFDIAAAFCPAGKLTMAETEAREAASILSAQGTEARRAETPKDGSVHDGPVAKPCAQTRSA